MTRPIASTPRRGRSAAPWLSLILVLASCGNDANGDDDSRLGETGGAGTGGGAAGGVVATGGLGGGGGSGGSSGLGVTGGNVGSGGSGATGGSVGSGGSGATGGLVATGGAVATGGIAGTGGASPTGGVTTGGVSPTGGVTTGGAAPTGGVTTGGVSATGGVTTGGASPTGGVTTGGVSPTGGVTTGGVEPTGGVAPTGGVGGLPSTSWKARVIHTTDLGADPDDEMSMVRALVMANDADLEGLIVATGCWKKSQSNTTMLDAIVDAYGEVVANLQVHDPSFPSVEYLRSISVVGQQGYGMGDVGEGRDTEGSNLIVAAVDSDDPRPVWATCWGGCNTIAQAVWNVQNSRSSVQLAEFIGRLRVYDILGQDDAGTWLAKNFPGLLYIRATQVYSWQPSDSWVDQHVQSHGPLGAVYPDKAWAIEGDTPAILHVLGNGLHDRDDLTQNGWGGRFTRKSGVRGMSCMNGEDGQYDPYEMYNEAGESIGRWKTAIQNDFEARMDWSVSSNFGDANHHPQVVLNGDTSRNVLEMSGSGSVELSAVGTSDPDGDSLGYQWWIDEDPSSGSGSISAGNSETVTVTVSGGPVHVVLEVVDDGSPNLTAYRRVIIQ